MKNKNKQKLVVTGLAAMSLTGTVFSSMPQTLAHAAATSTAPTSWTSYDSSAAKGNVHWTTYSPVITSDLVGKTIELRVDVRDGATNIECNTLGAGYTSKTTGKWVNITPDYTISGCWTGASNYAIKVTSDMVGGLVQFGGTATPTKIQSSYNFTTIWKIVGGATSPTATFSVNRTATNTTPSTTTKPNVGLYNLNGKKYWSIQSATITSDMVAKSFDLRVTPASGFTLNCDGEGNINTGLVGADGKVSFVDLDWYNSGCWFGGADGAFKVTSDMVGKKLQYSGIAISTMSDASLKITGSMTSNGTTTTVDSTGASNGTLVLSTRSTTTTPTTPITPTNPPTTTPITPPTSPTTPPASGTGLVGDAQKNQDVWLNGQLVAHPETAPEVNSSTSLSKLPRVAWNGGSQYWAQFPDAVKAGWTNPNFFPVMLWWPQSSTNEEVKYDQSVGINTYLGATNDNATTTKVMKDNGMFWIGNKLTGMNRSDTNFVGDWYDDEVDGRYSTTDGMAKMEAIKSTFPDHNKPRFTNYTGMVIQWMDKQNAEKYVNNYTDGVSIDAYKLSPDECDWQGDSYHGDVYTMPIAQLGCRTGQTYGKMQDALRIRDASDGKLQASSTFVEDVPVGVESTGVGHDFAPQKVGSAAFATIIKESRYLTWFNNSFSGKCASGNAIRDTQRQGTNYACYTYIQEMSKVNNLVKTVAPVLNTQSYVWYANNTTNTMLKQYNGAGYLFAMPKSTDNGGAKTFTVPDEMKGKTITVVDENRTIQPNSNGTFTDNFANGDSYHIYKIG